jgi:flagellar motility protein MotE (MotC chaperone)
MKDLLSSKATMVILGGLLYIGVTMFYIYDSIEEFTPVQKGDATKAEITPVLKGPSWDYKNPELDALVRELESRKEKIEKKEEELRFWELQINKELGNLTSITNRVENLQIEFERYASTLTENEEENIKRLLDLFKTLEPEQIGTILEPMADEKIAKIFRLLKPADVGPVVELWLSKGGENEKRIHDILRKYQGIIPEENLPEKELPPL